MPSLVQSFLLWLLGKDNWSKLMGGCKMLFGVWENDEIIRLYQAQYDYDNE